MIENNDRYKAHIDTAAPRGRNTQQCTDRNKYRCIKEEQKKKKKKIKGGTNGGVIRIRRILPSQLHVCHLLLSDPHYLRIHVASVTKQVRRCHIAGWAFRFTPPSLFPPSSLSIVQPQWIRQTDALQQYTEAEIRTKRERETAQLTARVMKQL